MLTAKGSRLTLLVFDGHRDIEGRLMCRQLPVGGAVLCSLLPPFSFLLFAETLAICAGRHMQVSAEDSTQGFRIVHPYASSNLSLGQT